MAVGRTTRNNVRLYADGYDWSGYSSKVGPLDTIFDFDALAMFSETIKGGLCAAPSFAMGTVNGIFDSTATSGLHVLASGTPTARDVMIPIGIRAAPAVGDPAFVGKFVQTGYQAVTSGVMVTATIPFAGYDQTDTVTYRSAWGNMVHVWGAETGANTGNTPNVNGGGATTAGGYMIYQIFARATTGSATISIDDSANGTDWLALSGATTGAIAHTAMPCAGIIALATTATVRQYLRWQLALSTLTTVTFALAFVRGLTSNV